MPKVKLVGALPALFGGAPGSFIVLEHVYNRSVESSVKDQAKLGAAVAALHNKKVDGGKFGFATPTMLGPLLLENEPSDDWAAFFVEHRLGQQFRVAGKRYRDRALHSLWRRLQLAAPRILGAERIEPSLLHGDLHVANAAAYEVSVDVFSSTFEPRERRSNWATGSRCCSIPPRSGATRSLTWRCATWSASARICDSRRRSTTPISPRDRNVQGTSALFLMTMMMM